MNREPLSIRLETQNYIVRSVERADANESWAKWMLDPTAARQLNLRPHAMTMDELRAYIDRFDRMNSHLLGIFEKDTGRIVGIRSVYVNFKTREFLDNVLIGEVDARGKRARSESSDAIWLYFFEEMGLEALVGTILAENKHMLDLVARKGFELVRSELKPSAVDGSLIEVRLFRLRRETWRRKLREREAAARTA